MASVMPAGLLVEVGPAAPATRSATRSHSSGKPICWPLVDLREVGAGEERPTVGEAEDRHRPPPAPGHRLDRLHVDRVDVGPLLAVDLDADEQPVDQRGDVGVLEGLVGHHVAPVAGGVADRDQHRHVPGGGLREGVGAPAPPLDGVVAVLGQVGRQLGLVLVTDQRHGSSVAVSRRRRLGPRPRAWPSAAMMAPMGDPGGLDLVIFDCDGVLVDTERVANQALADLVTDVGLPTSLDDSLRRYMGRALDDIVADVERDLGRSVGEGFADRYYERIFAVFDAGVDPVPGVAEVLAGLRWPVCVASNGPHAKMERTLGGSGLRVHFGDRLFSARDVARGKPAPDLFLHAAERMGAEPVRCVVVEDSPLGVAGARAAGMRVLGFADPGSHTDARALATGGATVFARMSELPALLAELDRELGGAAQVR